MRHGQLQTVFLRFALAVGFFSAVADRLGMWGPYGRPTVACCWPLRSGMLAGTDMKTAFGASVFAASGGAFMLATARKYPWSVDEAISGGEQDRNVALVKASTK